MATNEELAARVQQLYVSYYGRPADPAGLAFWIAEFEDSNNVDKVLEDFGAGPEYLAWIEDNDLEDPLDLINALYNQMFNRDGDAAGVAFYADLLSSGAASPASIALDIANGAQGQDITILDNKIEVSNFFTTDVEAKDAPYSEEDIPAGQALLVTVDETQVSVIVGKIAAETIVDSIVEEGTSPTDPTDPTDPTEPTSPTDPTDPTEPTDPSKSYTLTTNTDIIESGSGNDTFTAVGSGDAMLNTLNASDIILDSSKTDNDTLNLTLTAPNATASITSVENISINLDLVNGADAIFDAINVTGATISLRSTKATFDGEAVVDNAAKNSVTAGSKVTDLTVNGLTTGDVDGGSATTVTVTSLTTGTVDAGSATTVNVTGTVDVANTIEVTGTVTLTNTDSTLTTLITSSTSTVTYIPTANIATTVEGSGNLTLKMADEAVEGDNSLENDKSSGTLTLEIIGATSVFDATNFEVDEIVIGNAATVVGIVKSGQELSSTTALTSLTLSSTTDNATVSIETDSDIATLIINDAGGLTTSLKATDDLVIALLTAGANSLILTGSGDVSITSTDLTNIDASAHTGDFTLALSTGGSLTVTTGNGTNSLTVKNAIITTYVGGTGIDTIDATAVTAGILDISLGSGNDIVGLAGTIGALLVAIEGGSGTDIIQLADDTDLSDATTFSIATVEKFELLSVDTKADVIFAGSQLSGKSYTLFTEEEDDTATVHVTVNAATTDLSSLTLTEIDSVEITGQATEETIVGSKGNDIISGEGGADTLTGGKGDNIFVFTVAGISTAADMASITDYTDAVDTSDHDIIDLAQADAPTIPLDTVVGGPAPVPDAATGYTGNKIAINISTVDGIGIATLFGLDKAEINTLGEWIAALETGGVIVDLGNDTKDIGTVAFEFGGNTYLVTVQDDADNDLGTTEIIELTGLTGIDLLDLATAGPDTILIA